MISLVPSFAAVSVAGLSVNEVGGKGKQLSILAAAADSSGAIRVPPGSVVRTGAYRAHLARLPEASALRAAGRDIAVTPELISTMREAVTGLAVDPLLHSAVAAALAEICSQTGVSPDCLRVAVRSSGTSEDGATASFAGQYASVLNVHGSPDAVCAAVKEVWASQWSEHILTYLQAVALRDGESAAGAHPDAAEALDDGTAPLYIAGVRLPDMAVVIQAQVPSRRSGVLFTVSPDAAGDAHMVAESVWGQGEGLVSGEITPETVTVDWRDAAALRGAGLLDDDGAADWPRVIRRRAAPQLRKYTTVEGTGAGGAGSGIAVVETTPAERASTPLDGPLLRRLVRAGLAVAALRGCPQDIEWAEAEGQLYLVQTRPVTRFTFRRSLGNWGMTLASGSCLMDETLVGEGFRIYGLTRYPHPRTAAGLVEARLRFNAPPRGAPAVAAGPAAGAPQSQILEAAVSAWPATETGFVQVDPAPFGLRAPIVGAGNDIFNGALGAMETPRARAARRLAANMHPVDFPARSVFLVDAEQLRRQAGSAAGAEPFDEEAYAAAEDEPMLWIATVSSRDELEALAYAAPMCGAAALLCFVPASLDPGVPVMLDSVKPGEPPTAVFAATAAPDVAAVLAAAGVAVPDAASAAAAGTGAGGGRGRVGGADDYDDSKPWFRRLDGLSASITLQHTRVLHSRVFNNERTVEQAEAVGHCLKDPGVAIRSVDAAVDAFRSGEEAAIDDLCRRMFALRVAAAQRAAAIDSGVDAGAVPPLPPPLFPSPVAGHSIASAMATYSSATSLSWTVSMYSGFAEQEFDAQWAAVQETAHAAGVVREQLLTGLTSKNVMEALKTLAATHARNAAVAAICRDASIRDNDLAEAIFKQACTGLVVGPPPAAGAAGAAGGRLFPWQAADGVRMNWDPASPLRDVAADLLKWLGHYGWNALRDEDLATEHWAEGAAFPMGIWRKVLVAAADKLAAAPAAAPAAARAFARPMPPMPVAGGAGAGAGAGAGGIALPAGGPPLLHRLSSTASSEGFDAAKAQLMAAIGAAHPLWPALHTLRSTLAAKERIHTVYVRRGLLIKAMAQQWVCENAAVLQAAAAAASAGSAGGPAAAGGGAGGGAGAAPPEPAPSFDELKMAPASYWLDALRACDAALHPAARGGPAAAAERRHAALVELVKAARFHAAERDVWWEVSIPVRIHAGKRGKGSAATHPTAPPAGGGAGAAGGAGAGGRGPTQQLAGLGCSGGASGPIRGPARVVTSLGLAHTVQAGEILVTELTSPAWTPLFSLICGVVLEEGGMLSHGAVVARECGLPCVSQVAGATRLIQTGDILEVDGEMGTVVVNPA